MPRQFDNVKINFDFSTFTSSMVQLIDSICSKGRSMSDKPQESRINALYRAIGLPAVVNENSKISSDNNGNSFKSTQISISDEEKRYLAQRFFSKREPSSELVKNILETNSISIDDSMSPDKRTLRSADILLPLVSNGEIEVWPRDRRVGPAFSRDNDLRINKDTSYHRPFIETVIEIKLNAEGARNSVVQNKLQSEIVKAVGEIGNEIIYMFSSENNGGIGSFIANILENSIKEINSIRGIYSANVVPQSYIISGQNPEISESSDSSASLNIKKRQQESQLALKRNRLMLFEYEDTFGAESSVARNLKSPLIANDFLNIILNTNDFEKALKETDNSIERQSNDTKKVYQKLDSIFGIYSGVSGVDILAILIALFRLDSDVLIGLLNEENCNNFDKAHGMSDSFVDGKVNTSKVALENEVKNVFTEIKEEVVKTKQLDKSKNKLK